MLRRTFRRTLVRGYKTQTGVFGYYPRPKDDYEVPEDIRLARAANPNLYRLINSYRCHGHTVASINPLFPRIDAKIPELEPSYFNLTKGDLAKTQGLVESRKNIDTIEFLKRAYCQHLTADLSYLSAQKQDWIAAAIENAVDLEYDTATKKKISQIILQSEWFDIFLGTKFPTLKRYGLEGAESMLSFFYELLDRTQSFDTIVLAMTHRGRLNLLTGLLNIPPSLIFRKIRGGSEMSVKNPTWIGDVLSHLICSEKIGKTVVSMVPNPSHLEIVNPVSMGKTRAKQMRTKTGRYSKNNEGGNKILNVQVHGDAAFSGQGLNQEMLAFTKVPHFEIGGSIHLIVNNQIGFTTPEERGRSSRYTSDLAKMIDSPVLHVNGDDPEAVMKAAKIAVDFQKEFEEDVFVELHAYRRRGHNELDDPTFSNPVKYAKVYSQPTLPAVYAEKLENDGILSQADITSWKEEYLAYLNKEFRQDVQPPTMHLLGHWKGIQEATQEVTTWDTGVPLETLRYLGLKSVQYPKSFDVHQHLLKTHIKNRENLMLNPQTARLDWSSAEALAFGSLLIQGFNVRLSGQDVGRGTFSHRHVMLVNQSSGDIYIPLNDCGVQNQGHLEVANSILSEESVLAFEYGMSIECPKTLVLWEAQFGDFANGAQNVIDTYVASGESKWARSSSLTLLLPHGYDGAGPEHSSCRIERFLQLTDSSEIACDSDNVNMQVAWPTTPSQYFHILRRQQIRNFRKPLVIVGPKTLLRLPEATSSFEDLQPGTHFQNVIKEDNRKARKVVITSGKHYYNLQSKPDDVALVRLESLVPFPAGDLQSLPTTYPCAREFVWSQEEPRNMGAWSFIKPRFENLVGIRLSYCGRPQIASPAYGLPDLHKASLQAILKDTFS